MERVPEQGGGAGEEREGGEGGGEEWGGGGGGGCISWAVGDKPVLFSVSVVSVPVNVTYD